MGVSTFVQPDFTSQSATVYKTSIDDGFAVHNQIAGAFAPHEQSTPDLTVRLDAANFSDLVSRTTITHAAQNTAFLTAPSVDPRNDIVHVDRITGDVGVETGTEAASPVDPTIPVGKLPVARINWTTSMTEITNTDLDDIRALGSLGLSTAAFVNIGTTADLIPIHNSDGGITLEGEGAGAGLGPVLDLYRNSPSVADDDNIGAQDFSGQNSVPEKHVYARIVARILDFTDGTEDTRLSFLTDLDGTLAARMMLEAGLQLGSPTDGDKGAGTGNFEGGVYDDGSLLISGVKEFFILIAAGPTSLGDAYNNAVGDFAVGVVNASEDINFNFQIPANFTSLVDAVVVVIPDTTETIQWDVTTDFGAVGEAYNANSDSDADATLAVTLNQLAECDVSPALTGIAANDYVGLAFASDTADIRVIGMRIKYT